jgi:hypothetical protein
MNNCTTPPEETRRKSSVTMALCAILFGLLVVPPLDRTRPSLGFLWDRRDAVTALLLDLEDVLLRWHRWVDRHWAGTLFATERLVYSESRFFGSGGWSTPGALHLLNEHGGGGGRLWWTPVSYMFVHGSYRHLLGNLLSLACSWRGVTPRLGTGPALGFFLSGGAFAALNSSARALQLERRVGAWFTVAPAAAAGALLPEQVGWAHARWGAPPRVLRVRRKKLGRDVVHTLLRYATRWRARRGRWARA